MKKLVILSYCLFSITHSIGQTFFQTYPGYNLKGSALQTSPDGNLFVGGGKGDSAMILKIDPDGNIIWTVIFKPTSSSNNFAVTSIEITPDNFLIGTGISMDVNLNPDDGFYFKMDINGIIQFAYIVTGIIDRFTIRKIIPLESSIYILIAAHESFSGSWADPILIKVNGTTGAVISESSKYDYGNMYIDDISESILRSDKKFIYSTGRLYLNGAGQDQMRIFLTRFDTLGNEIWTKYFIYPTTISARMYGSAILEDHDSLVIGYFGDNAGYSSNFQIGMVKTDSTGNMVWSKNYDITSSTYERCFRILKTSYGYALIGFSTTSSEDLMILATDINGNLLWCKSYGDNILNEDNLNAFGSLPSIIYNGYIYFTGQRLIGGNQTDLVIGKADINGIVNCIINQNLPVITTINPVFTDTRIVSSFPDPVLFDPINTFSYPNIPSPCSINFINLGNDTSICNGYIVLNSTIPGAIQYLWQDGSTNATDTATISGEYSVTVTVDCCIYHDTINVLIGQPSSINQNITLCAGDTFFIGSNIIVHSGYFSDTLISATGCDSIISGNVSFDSLFQINASGGDSICKGNDITLSSTGAFSYSWSPYSSLTCSACPNPVASPIITTTYTVTGTDANGCTALDSTTVFVLPLPQIFIPDPPVVYCNLPVPLTVIGESSYSYTWSPIEFNNNPSSDSTSVNPLETSVYSVTAVDLNGCSATDSVKVIVYGEGPLAIPNAFTPNGDGINDLYRIIHFCPVELQYFKIFNRWGELVFQTSDLNTGWDGTYNNIISDIDVYVYVISARDQNGSSIFLKGNVTLVR